MNISFDLDGTLVPLNNEFETEKFKRFYKFLGVKKIRKGTKNLINILIDQGHNIHIYTTSYRSKHQIRRTFRYYGIRINQLINQNDNVEVLKKNKINASKYPPAFHIDIHIDDSKGLEIEGKRYNFKTIIIDPKENNWTEAILNTLNKV